MGRASIGSDLNTFMTREASLPCQQCLTPQNSTSPDTCNGIRMSGEATHSGSLDVRPLRKYQALQREVDVYYTHSPSTRPTVRCFCRSPSVRYIPTALIG